MASTVAMPDDRKQLPPPERSFVHCEGNLLLTELRTGFGEGVSVNILVKGKQAILQLTSLCLSVYLRPTHSDGAIVTKLDTLSSFMLSPNQENYRIFLKLSFIIFY